MITSTLLLDETFLRSVSSRLERFKQTGSHHFNARCPICGDSQKNRSKARFHVFEHNKNSFLVCKCFNCGYANSFDNFLKEFEPETHKMYLMEKFKGANNKPELISSFVQSKPVFDTSPLKRLKKISQLAVDHPIRFWVNKRRIPPKQHYRMYLCPKFKQWTNSVLPNKFDEKALENDEPRLVIPLFDEYGNMFGFQGRAFKKDSVRYITIMLDDSRGRIFGLDALDKNKTAYCVEGPIDSMFISNAIASCGGDIISELQLLNMEKESIVVVYDNEPRNIDTIKKIEKSIDAGYKVCIWPEYIEQKDINDMVIAGYSPMQIKSAINENTFEGLSATLRLAQWRKL